MASKEKLEEIRKQLQELIGKASEIGKFAEYVHAAESPKTLDTKTKELISLGIAIAVRCEPCIIWHTEAAVKAGATEEEILDVIKVAVCMGGGPALMYSLRAYEIAMEFLGK
ncbi:carboxymuconolactone decarboxylase family protein [Thermotoga sp. KOL6]|uniref:carboxymuconolactone decarboxylase family protein n=1 Tax=Thermotoga sp. KOL6 TaxID=126741 RepID=UPI000C795652|nr:carboxymuconolactone decarboxylase family protein [Thermotoga sp. KOL6]PLV59121.1 carboxymuconolactone decarboxylase [Thermotoga sp. KOL6]